METALKAKDWFQVVDAHQVRVPDNLRSKHLYTCTLQIGKPHQDLICIVRSAHGNLSLESSEKNCSCNSLIILCHFG